MIRVFYRGPNLSDTPVLTLAVSFMKPWRCVMRTFGSYRRETVEVEKGNEVIVSVLAGLLRSAQQIIVLRERFCWERRVSCEEMAIAVMRMMN